MPAEADGHGSGVVVAKVQPQLETVGGEVETLLRSIGEWPLAGMRERGPV